MKEGQDFHVVSEEGWKKLHGWYGGGPAIARPIDTKRYRRVLLHPLRLEVVVKDPNNGKEQSVTLSVPHQVRAWSLTTPWHDAALHNRIFHLQAVSQGTQAPHLFITSPATLGLLPKAPLARSQTFAHTLSLPYRLQTSLTGIKSRACKLLQIAQPDSVTLWDYTGGRKVRCLERPAEGEEDDQGPANAGAGGNAAPSGSGGSRTQPPPPAPPLPPWSTGDGKDGGVEQEGGAKDAMAVDGPLGSTPGAAQGDGGEGVAAMETDGPAGAGAAEGAQGEGAAAAAAGGGGGGNDYMDNTTAAALGLMDKQLLRLRRRVGRVRVEGWEAGAFSRSGAGGFRRLGNTGPCGLGPGAGAAWLESALSGVEAPQTRVCGSCWMSGCCICVRCTW